MRKGTPITRIALVFEYATLNGGEWSMLTMLDRLAGVWEFVALAPQAGRLAEALCDRRIKHVPLDLCDQEGQRLSRDDACRNLLAAIQSASPQLVHANSLAMGRLTGAIAAELALPTLAHLRDILKLSKAAVDDLNRNQWLIAVSRATRDFHVAQGLDPARTSVLYNGVDCDRFRPRAQRGDLKRELGLPHNAFLVLTVGQIGLRKGQDVLAEAAAKAAQRLSDVHYLIVGERNSSKRESIEFERELVHRFDRAGLEDRLHRLGYRDDVARIMNEADLLVHPAHQEPLGRVLLEAAACGLPIVATDVGGTPEILAEGVSARLIPPNDSVALAEAIVELRADHEQRALLADNARKQAETVFDASRASAELSRFWKRVADVETG